MSEQMSGLTLVLGERRSGKMHKALEMAKGNGRLVCMIVPHLEVRARRAEMASKGVMVFSDRNVGMRKRRDLAFVIDRASALVISRFMAPDVPVYATSYRSRTDPWIQSLEAAGARVIEAQP
jgi:hypothetical protein